jgi:type IV pilus assembly protein PilB
MGRRDKTLDFSTDWGEHGFDARERRQPRETDNDVFQAQGSAAMSQTLDQMLTSLGLPPDALEHARQSQSTAGGSLRDNLIALNIITVDDFARLVTEHLRMPYVNPKDTAITDEALSLLPRDKAEKYAALPLILDSKHRRLSIALADPTNMLALDELKFVIGHTLIPHFTPEDELREAIQREYTRFEASQAVVTARRAQVQPVGTAEFRFPTIDVAALSSGDDALRLLGAMLTEAYARKASEIHLGAYSDGVRLAFRIQGQQTAIATFPRPLASVLLPRLRRLLVGETGDRSGLVQQGIALLKLQNKKELDLSYTVCPTLFLDQVWIKLKDRYTLPGLDDLRLAPDAGAALQQTLSELRGLVLVTGTAKHGVTTTLYTLLTTVSPPTLRACRLKVRSRC